MLNKIILIGRLTVDPTLRFAANTGNAITTFTLAVDRNYKTKEGIKETDYLPIVVFNKLAEIVANHLSKGKQCAVSGRMQTRSYEASDGTKRYVTEVVADDVQFLGSKGQGQANPDTGNDFSTDDDFTAMEGDNNDIPF